MNRSQPPPRQPRTFLDWGVAVPFTTPALQQARVRPAARGGRIDVVMPNPAGGKGVYVMDLGAVGEVMSPTLHDRLLVERLLELPVVTPEEIRRSVRELAIEGAAGRAAKRAAAVAQAEDEAACLAMQLRLIDRLLEFGGAERIDWLRSGAAGQSLGRTVRARIASVAPRVGCGTNELLDLFERVAAAAAHVGMPGGPPGGSRDERQIERVDRLARDLRAWAESGPDGIGQAEDAAAVLGDLAERTVREAERAHATARELLDAVPALIQAWRAARADLLGAFARTDWLLDGWQQVCASWEAVAREQRPAQRAALEEAQRLIPFLDPANRWDTAAGAAAGEHLLGGRRRVRLYEDWRTGLLIAGAAARAETARAAAL